MSRLAGLLAVALLCTAAPSAGEGILRIGTGLASPTSQLEGLGYGGGSAGAIPILVINVETDYRIEPQEAAIAFLGYEWPISKRFGLEVTAESLRSALEARATHTVRAIDYSAADGTPVVSDPVERRHGHSGRFRALPVTLGLNYHPIRDGRLGVYFGPVVGWAFVSDAEYDTSFGLQKVALDDALIYGAVVGLDSRIGEGRWSFHAAVRYLEMELRQDRVARILLDRYQLPTDHREANDLEVDPLSLRIGLARGFGAKRNRYKSPEGRERGTGTN